MTISHEPVLLIIRNQNQFDVDVACCQDQSILPTSDQWTLSILYNHFPDQLHSFLKSCTTGKTKTLGHTSYLKVQRSAD